MSRAAGAALRARKGDSAGKGYEQRDVSVLGRWRAGRNTFYVVEEAKRECSDGDKRWLAMDKGFMDGSERWTSVDPRWTKPGHWLSIVGPKQAIRLDGHTLSQQHADTGTCGWVLPPFTRLPLFLTPIYASPPNTIILLSLPTLKARPRPFPLYHYPLPRFVSQVSPHRPQPSIDRHIRTMPAIVAPQPTRPQPVIAVSTQLPLFPVALDDPFIVRGTPSHRHRHLTDRSPCTITVSHP